MKTRTLVLATALLTALSCKSKDKEAPPQEAVQSVAAAPSAPPAEPPMTKVKAASLQHLPETCHVVVHMDVARLLSSDVVKKNLVPQLEEMQKPGPGNANTQSFRAFIDALGMDPLKDLASMSVCMGPEPPAGQTPPMVTILGGTFGKDKLLDAFRKYSPKRGTFKDMTLSDGTPAIVAEQLYTAQTKDGAPLFGTDEALLVAASKTSEAYKAYDIPSDVELSVRVTKAAIDRMAASPQTAGPFGQLLKGASTALITISLKQERLLLTASHKNPATAKAASQALGVGIKQLGKQAEMAARMNPQAAMMADIANRAKVSAEGSAVQIAVEIPPEAIVGFFQQMSAGMAQQMAAIGAPPGLAPIAPGMPGAMPPGALPPGVRPPGAMPPGVLPPSTVPPGATPLGASSAGAPAPAPGAGSKAAAPTPAGPAK